MWSYENHQSYIALVRDIDSMCTALQILEDNMEFQPLMTIMDERAYIVPSRNVSSALGSLESIKSCVLFGRMADAYTLTRKVRDDLMQHVFLHLTTMDAKEMEKIQCDDIVFDEFNEETFIELISNAWNNMINRDKTEAEKAVYAWLKDELEQSHNKKYRFHYFGAEKYIMFIKNNSSTKDCFSKFFDQRFIEMNVMLNNYVHGNGFTYIISNMTQNEPDFEKHCNNLIDALVLITSAYVSIITIIRPSVLMASDYIDALDMGSQPPEGSQYWVAAGIQDFISEYLPKIDPELKDYLRDNNPHNMGIE